MNVKEEKTPRIYPISRQEAKPIKNDKFTQNTSSFKLNPPKIAFLEANAKEA